MAKNRKNQSAAVRFGPVLKVFLLCVFVGGSGVGYVWQKQQIYELSREIKDREERLEGLRRQNERLSRTLMQLESHRDLDAQARQMDLGLVPPQPHQVVRLGERLPEESTLGRRLFAEKPSE